MIKNSINILKKLYKASMRFYILQLVRTSSLFDRAWYLEHNPDVAIANVNPAVHYVQVGGSEGRDPGPNFSGRQYLALYDDVRQAGLNPLIHYLMHGRKEGRKIFKVTAPSPIPIYGKMRNSFLSSFISEIGINLYNSYTDNYDPYRFGNNYPETSMPVSTDPLAIANTLVDAIGIVEDYLPRFENVFKSLADDESRNILIKLLAFRALGNKRVKLPLNTPTYWEGIKEIEDLSNPSKVVQVPDEKWKLPLINLNRKGIPLTLFGVPFGTYTQFILEHYKCNTGHSNIGVEEGDFVIDAGACWGDTALYFANLAGPTGRVFSFEFVPGNLHILLRNLDLNSSLKQRIDVVEKAVWNQSDLKISFSEDGPATRVDYSKSTANEVETLSIDDLVTRANISHLDFIKMDIEGAELEALRGAIKTIRNYRPKLAISIYHKFLDYLEIPEFILSLDLGYQLYIRHFTIHAEETVLFAQAGES